MSRIFQESIRVYNASRRLYSSNLDLVMNVEKVKKLKRSDISQMWKEFHSKRPNTLSGTMNRDFYDKLNSNLIKYPLFTLPVVGDGGFQAYLMQAESDKVSFTSLHEYKLKQSNAIPHISLTNYTQLASSHDLVLMKGEVASMDVTQAQSLVYQMQLFYATCEMRFKLVQRFHEDPQRFDFDQVVRAVTDKAFKLEE